jgi:hypothetical protein
LKRKPLLKEAVTETLEVEEEGETFPGVSQLCPEYSIHCGAVILVVQQVIKIDMEMIVKRRLPSSPSRARNRFRNSGTLNSFVLCTNVK